MPKSSKSIRRKKKKSKFIQKLKQPWRVTRNWLRLPSDLMLNILQRLGVVDRLENAQLVCTAWREMCKDPSMWRVVCLERSDFGRAVCKEMCKQAVDRSQGQLVDLTMVRFCDYELLQYVADRSCQLRRLEILYYFGGRYGGKWSEAFKNLSLLEELSLVRTKVQVEYIEAAGRYCPMLKRLKLNRKASYDDDDYDDYVIISNEIALAIGKNLPGLTHLELIGSGLENVGLQAILEGCCHLESLDLRRCSGVDLKGGIGKRCSQQIKHLKLPHHSLEGYLSSYDILYHFDDGHYNYDDDTSCVDDYTSDTSYVDDDTSDTSYDDDDVTYTTSYDGDDTSSASYVDDDTSTTSYDDDDDDDDDDTSIISYDEDDDSACDVDDYDDNDDDMVGGTGDV